MNHRSNYSIESKQSILHPHNYLLITHMLILSEIGLLYLITIISKYCHKVEMLWFKWSNCYRLQFVWCHMRCVYKHLLVSSTLAYCIVVLIIREHKLWQSVIWSYSVTHFDASNGTKVVIELDKIYNIRVTDCSWHSPSDISIHYPGLDIPHR